MPKSPASSSSPEHTELPHKFLKLPCSDETPSKPSSSHKESLPSLISGRGSFESQSLSDSSESPSSSDPFEPLSVYSKSKRLPEQVEGRSRQLNQAIRQRNLKKVVSLVNSGVNVDRPYASPYAPPYARDFYVHYNIFLADCEFEGLPIWHAACSGSEFIKILLDAGATVDTQYANQGTALQIAARRGNYESVELLLIAGADVNAPPGMVGTALSAALSTQERTGPKIALLLLQHGANLECAFKDGDPLKRFLLDQSRGLFVTALLKLWWRTNSVDHKYGSDEELVSELVDADAMGLIRLIRIKRNFPKALVSGEDSPIKRFQTQFALVTNESKSSAHSVILGTTWSDIVLSCWGEDGIGILGWIAHNVCNNAKNDVDRISFDYDWHDSTLSESLDKFSINDDNCDIYLGPKPQTPAMLKKILGVVSFFSKAITNSPRSRFFSSVTASSRLWLRRVSQDLEDVEHPLFVQVLVYEHPFEKSKDNCWQNLFDNAFVASILDETMLPTTLASGKGLSVSFGHMVSLASIEYSIVTEETIILVGYRTALVPTLIDDSFVQYHLLVSESGQIDISQFPKELKQAIKVQDLATLQARRCFVGWCGEVDVRLGTEEFVKSSRPHYSNAEKKKRSLRLSGISLGMGIVSTAPVQTGPTLQVSGVFVENHVKFTYSRVYSQLLRDTAREIALLYDVEARRGWVVSKLSLLLYMCHVHVIEREKISLVPFVSGHTDPETMLPCLDQKGDLVLYGSNSDALRLRTLMTGLNMNMMFVMDKAEPGKGTSLYGYEFLDIVNGPGKGAWMKEVRIRSNGADLIRMANFVDVVVIGAGFGDVIGPSNSKRCQNSEECVIVPAGLEYLTIPIHCIMKLVLDHHGDVEGNFENHRVELADGIYWTVSALAFKPCAHEKGSKESCWNQEERFQRFVKSRLRERLAQGLNGSPLTLPNGGAVVFGKPKRC